MRMPEPDQRILSRRHEIVAALQNIVPGAGVIHKPAETRVYETDGLSAYRQMPLAVVLPSTTRQISQILRYCEENGVKVVARGAGTGLTGGALPIVKWTPILEPAA